MTTDLVRTRINVVVRDEVIVRIDGFVLTPRPTAVATVVNRWYPSAIGFGTPKTISRAVVALHKKHLGRGPDRAKTYLHDDCALVLMYEGHTRSEHTLFARGEEKSVAQQRVRSSDAIHRELIESRGGGDRAQGDRVHEQQSAEPSLLSHVFVLDPTDLFDAAGPAEQ